MEKNYLIIVSRSTSEQTNHYYCGEMMDHNIRFFYYDPQETKLQKLKIGQFYKGNYEGVLFGTTNQDGSINKNSLKEVSPLSVRYFGLKTENEVAIYVGKMSNPLVINGLGAIISSPTYNGNDMSYIDQKYGIGNNVKNKHTFHYEETTQKKSSDIMRKAMRKR